LINLLGNALKFNHQGMINMRLTMRKDLVEQAFNGQQALDKVPAGNYDLVLMDMHMPVMDGHQATQRLRAN